MTGNLVSLVLQYLTPDVIARIANALGLDRAVVEKAITAAVPALLAAFASNAANPAGAERLAKAVRQFDPNVLPQASKAFGSDKQGSLMDAGKAILSSALGGSSSSALSQTLSKFGDVNAGTASSLLSLVAPVVLGAIKSKSPNLDANGLTDLFASQKGNITSALPSGMLSALTDGGVIDGLDKVKRSVGETASHTAEIARKAQPPAMQTKWLTWLIPLIALAALAWYFYGPTAQKVTTPTTTEVTQPLVVDGIDVGKEVTAVADQMKSTLEAVTDAASAQAAIPKLNEVSARADKLTEVIGKLSPEQKKIAAGLVGAVLPTLNTLADKVLAMPGVGEVLKPIIDGLRTKLDALSKA